MYYTNEQVYITSAISNFRLTRIIIIIIIAIIITISMAEIMIITINDVLPAGILSESINRFFYGVYAIL